MFVFYFGVIAAITPPVALASYAGAGLAGADANRTGWSAVKIGLAGFILPYMFILRPAILAQGTILEIVQTTVIATIAVMSLSASMYGMPTPKKLPRILMGLSAIIMLYPGTITDLIGIVTLAVALSWGKIGNNKITKKEASR